MDRTKKWFDAWHEKYGGNWYTKYDRAPKLGFVFCQPEMVDGFIAQGAQLVVVDDPDLLKSMQSPVHATCLCVCPYSE